MAVGASLTLVDDEELWSGLTAYVTSLFGGPVGIIKMMKVPNEKEGERVWAGRVRPVLDQIMSVLPVEYERMARFSTIAGVGVQFDTSLAKIQVDGVTRLRTYLSFDPAALVLAVVGLQRWGEAWVTALSEHEHTYYVINAASIINPKEFTWMAKDPDRNGPYTNATTEADALLAAVAEDLGFAGVSELYRVFETEHTLSGGNDE